MSRFGGEDQAVILSPGRACGVPFFGLAAKVFTQDDHGVAVDADHPGPATLGGPFHPLAADDGGGTAERDLGGVQVDGVPAQVEQLAPAGAGVGGEPVEGVQAVRAGGGQEGM